MVRSSSPSSSEFVEQLNASKALAPTLSQFLCQLRVANPGKFGSQPRQRTARTR